jgi:hypothetical protein
MSRTRTASRKGLTVADEYTPSTDEIRRGYIGEPDHFMDPLVGAEFDRWLAAERAKAWDEGDQAREAFTRAAYDASVPARDALALLPNNPYRQQEGADRG